MTRSWRSIIAPTPLRASGYAAGSPETFRPRRCAPYFDRKLSPPPPFGLHSGAWGHLLRYQERAHRVIDHEPEETNMTAIDEQTWCAWCDQPMTPDKYDDWITCPNAGDICIDCCPCSH